MGLNLRKISKRRGSLNLSINAIVVLILAITMLGLGLGFMKKMFGSTTAQFEEIGGAMKEQLMQDLKGANERLTLSKEDIDIKKGTQRDLYYAIKNDLSQSGECECLSGDCPSAGTGYCGQVAQQTEPTCTETGYLGPYSFTCGWVEGGDATRFMVDLRCYDALEGNHKGLLKFQFLEGKLVKPDEIAVLKAVVDVPSTTQVTTYSCKIGVCYSVADPKGASGVIASVDAVNDLGTLSCGSGGTFYDERDFYINVVTS